MLQWSLSRSAQKLFTQNEAIICCGEVNIHVCCIFQHWYCQRSLLAQKLCAVGFIPVLIDFYENEMREQETEKKHKVTPKFHAIIEHNLQFHFAAATPNICEKEWQGWKDNEEGEKSGRGAIEEDRNHCDKRNKKKELHYRKDYNSFAL